MGLGRIFAALQELFTLGNDPELIFRMPLQHLGHETALLPGNDLAQGDPILILLGLAEKLIFIAAGIVPCEGVYVVSFVYVLQLKAGAEQLLTGDHRLSLITAVMDELIGGMGRCKHKGGLFSTAGLGIASFLRKIKHGFFPVDHLRVADLSGSFSCIQKSAAILLQRKGQLHGLRFGIRLPAQPADLRAEEHRRDLQPILRETQLSLR